VRGVAHVFSSSGAAADAPFRRNRKFPPRRPQQSLYRPRSEHRSRLEIATLN
jgi:hypothetical protein